jgi:hypothetical protein
MTTGYPQRKPQRGFGALPATLRVQVASLARTRREVVCEKCDAHWSVVGFRTMSPNWWAFLTEHAERHAAGREADK